MTRIHEDVTESMGALVMAGAKPVLITFNEQGLIQAMGEVRQNDLGFDRGSSSRDAAGLPAFYMGQPWRKINDQVERVRVWSDREELPAPPEPDPMELLVDIMSCAMMGIDDRIGCLTCEGPVNPHIKRHRVHPIEVNGRRFLLRLDEF
jgi:hypothetical protein